MTQFDSKLIAQAKKTKGYLIKKSSSTFSSWKKKYFIFLDHSLCIFKDQTLQTLQKSINFFDITEVVPFETFQIQIKTKKKSYFLKAESPTDQDLWIASLTILRQNYFENKKSPKKLNSRSESNEKALTSSFKSSDQATEKSRIQSPEKKENLKENIIYLLRQKQLSKLLGLINLQKLSMVTKEEKYLGRILFIEDKKNGIYFSLSSKSIYPVIDGWLTRQDFIYPYQLNVLYFLPMNTYKNALQSNNKSVKLIQICKCSQILDSSIVNLTTIRLQIHCHKPIQIEVKHLSEGNIKKLSQCIRKLIEVGKQYWNPKGKLMKNIDEFIHKYQQNNCNELVFYKMIENEFEKAVIMNGKLRQDKKEIENYLTKIDDITNNLRYLIDACQIKSPPLNQLKEKIVKLYHKFVYNYLNQNWNFVYKNASSQDLIIYSKKVYLYFELFNPIHNDFRVKEGCKTLLKIALRNFHVSITLLNKNFTGIDQESLRILKKTDFQKDNQTITDYIFFSTYCTNFFSVLTLQFRSLTQIPKRDEFVKISWAHMNHIFKTAFQKLSQIAENSKERSSLISISNSLNILKKKKIPELFTELQKTLLCTYKKEKQDFIKEINYEITLVENFCIKKLFIISFGSIDKEILKSQIRAMDFSKICSVVIEQISKLQNILPEVRTALYEAAFEEVCYFFYICIVKFDNKVLTKDECLLMINQKMTAIRDSFFTKVDEQKVMSLLKDLNLLKQFITCPTNNLKPITKDLKRVFGSNFTELNLKNIISLRVSTLKQKQFIFQECRQEIKSSYNSTEQIDSFQRESFFNSSSRRQRVSTLTESLKSYHEQFQKVESIQKKQRTILFGVEESIHQGYMYRKRVINSYNTSYNKFFYRLKKGKLLQYDNEFCQDILNCYILNQLKKCYLEPEKNEYFHLQFERQILKFKAARYEDASHWIQKILEAMEDQKSLLQFHQSETPQDGVLFEDFSKKITLQTKSTKQASSPRDRNKMKKNDQIQDGKISLLSPKKPQNVSPIAPKKILSPPKNKIINQVLKQKIIQKQKRKRTKQKGCGSGCNFF